MQIAVKIGLLAAAMSAGSHIIFLKFHRQLSSLIEGGIYRENIEDWSDIIPIRYKASSKQIILQTMSFGLAGVTIGLMVEVEQWPVLFYITGTFAFILFCLTVKEIMRNFPIELERNRRALMKQRQQQKDIEE